MKTLLAMICALAWCACRAEALPALHVAGRELKTADGRVVRLQGVNIASLEWSNAGDRELLRSAQVAANDWHCNALRLPLAQDRWFGKADGQTDGGASYRQIVDDFVQFAALKGCYTILDLHWSDAGVWGKAIGQHKMPDPNSVTFWQSAARRYGRAPEVLFDLYNEPRDVSWDIWKNGGTVTEKDEKTGTETTYATPGMQKLAAIVRAAGAKNVLVIGGLDWAYDLSGVTRGYALTDKNGSGIVYSAHIYPWKTDWDGKVGVAADKYPVLIGEVGCEPDSKNEDPAVWAPKVLAFIEKRRLHWTAWCFHPSASPRLLQNFDNYAPTPFWGVPVKNALTRTR